MNIMKGNFWFHLINQFLSVNCIGNNIHGDSCKQIQSIKGIKVLKIYSECFNWFKNNSIFSHSLSQGTLLIHLTIMSRLYCWFAYSKMAQKHSFKMHLNPEFVYHTERVTLNGTIDQIAWKSGTKWKISSIFLHVKSDLTKSFYIVHLVDSVVGQFEIFSNLYWKWYSKNCLKINGSIDFLTLFLNLFITQNPPPPPFIKVLQVQLEINWNTLLLLFILHQHFSWTFNVCPYTWVLWTDHWL